jgi:hypothetical protein
MAKKNDVVKSEKVSKSAVTKKVKKEEKVERNDKELLHVFFYELNGLTNCLFDMLYNDDEKKKEEAKEAIEYMFDRAYQLVEWADKNFDMYEESKDCDQTKSYADFEKFWDAWLEE